MIFIEIKCKTFIDLHNPNSYSSRDPTRLIQRSKAPHFFWISAEFRTLGGVSAILNHFLKIDVCYLYLSSATFSCRAPYTQIM